MERTNEILTLIKKLAFYNLGVDIARLSNHAGNQEGRNLAINELRQKIDEFIKNSSDIDYNYLLNLCEANSHTSTFDGSRDFYMAEAYKTAYEMLDKKVVEKEEE